MYMHFSKSLQGSKSAITIRPVSIELCFVVIPSYIELSCFNLKVLYFSETFDSLPVFSTNLIWQDKDFYTFEYYEGRIL